MTRVACPVGADPVGADHFGWWNGANRSDLYELERIGRRKVSVHRKWMSRRDLK